MNKNHRYIITAALLTMIFLISQSRTVISSGRPDHKIRRAVDQARIDEIKRHTLNVNNMRSAYISEPRAERRFDESIIPTGTPAAERSSAHSSIPSSPGIVIGQSLYDFQDNDSPGRHVARMPGADIVHFVWHDYTGLPGDVCDPDRAVKYNSLTISSGTLNQGSNGVFIGDGVNGGYPGGDVFDDNTFHLVLHDRANYSAIAYRPVHLAFPTPGSAAFIVDTLSGYTAGGCLEVLWPRIATSRDGDRTIHVLAHSNTNDCPTDLLWYWRYNGAVWTGPIIIDSTPQISYVLADDPSGDKVAIAVHVSNYISMNGINNVAYLESSTDGAGWIADTEPKIKSVLTNYDADAGPGAWLHLSAAYDHAGILHIVWDEQEDANDNAKTAIRHWNAQRQIVRTVALGYWDTPLLTGVYNLNLAKVTLGIGDGGTLCQGGAESNEDYLYVLYTQFGGPSPEEQADHSLDGYYNGELYLTASTSGGNTWSTPMNLTNTKTPSCNPGGTINCTHTPPDPDSVCRSEHWATIGLAVSDIDIFFISDLDAGGIPQGEGTWQMNPVHYYRIPGGTTDAQYLCPLIAPNFEASLTSDPACEYHASPAGSQIQTLTIMNLGNGPLSGTITVTDFPGNPVLDVSGSPVFSIAAGGADDIRTVTMSANGATEGLYSGLISIAHDDSSEPSPKEFPIDFFVFNEFFCPIFEVWKTGVASPGSLAMAVTNDGRFGDGNPMHALWRHKDSSSSVDAGTFLIAHGTQGPDTTVFLHYGTRASNGQRGFRAVSDLIIDTSAYSSGLGCAGAVSQFVTSDSVVGVAIEWVFPQPYDQDEFVHANIRVYRHDASRPITDLAIGILVDMDAIPASRLGSIQLAATNEPGSDGTRNLVWTGGVDTAGHFITGQNTATRFRGGIVVPGGFEGALVGNYASDIAPGGGPTDGYLYFQLQNLQGIDLYSVADTDLYVMIALDKGRSIAFAETLEYSFALVSDTVSEASLKATVDHYETVRDILGNCFGDPPSCPCWADPNCDGIRSDVIDVVGTINVAFRGSAPTMDFPCPVQRTDVDANGVTDVVDVVRVVNVAFRGASVASQYVNPFGP